MNSRYLLFILIIIIALTGCGTVSPVSSSSSVTNQVASSDAQTITSPTVSLKSTLIVFAAASLTGAFQEIGEDFENANPDVTVRFNFAGSQILSTQIEQGASVDVFASADQKNMNQLVTDNMVNGNTYQDFVTNQLIVILPAGNPAKVSTLADLARPHLKLILADSTVPAGNYARQMLINLSKDPTYGDNFNAKVLANIVSNETDVKQVVAKVELGEGDAGIVYVSDAIAKPDLATIAIPGKFNITARYPIAILTNAPEPQLAEGFIAYILSPAGQTVMMKWGFGPVAH